MKYHLLAETPLADIKWTALFPHEPYFFFVPKDFSNKDDYDNGFRISDLFPVFSSGVKTQKDDASIKFNQKECDDIRNDFINLSVSELTNKYHFEDVRDWTNTDAKNDMIKNGIISNKILYRPLDFRSINYTGKSGIIAFPRFNVLRHLTEGNNFALIAARQCKDDFGVFITQFIAIHKSCVSYDTNSIFPLYLYPDENSLDAAEPRRPNLNMEIVNTIAEKINLTFTAEKQENENAFAPIDILDYMYAVLYSNKYRQKYMEFLKIDFPRVPYPENAGQFYKLAATGSVLRSIHLMETVTPINDLAAFPIEGSNIIETVKYTGGKVYINKQQYFENVPAEIWQYYIGGYQPAQKWLKDRKANKDSPHVLDFSEKEHYQKIIAVIKTTMDLQAQIDELLESLPS
jgi:predicted helicase